MALEKQLVPISFAQGLDTYTDDKQVLPGKLLVLENGIFKNPGKISKRNGFDVLSRDANGGSINSGQALSVYNDELLQFSANGVYSFIESAEIWTKKGDCYSVITDTQQIIRNNNQQTNPEVGYLDGFELYAWEDSRGGVKYTLIDSGTKASIVTDVQVDFAGVKPKIITYQGLFVIFFMVDSALQFRTIDPNSPFAIAPAKILASDVNQSANIYDVMVVNGGLTIFVLYQVATSKTIRTAFFTGLSSALRAYTYLYNMTSFNANCLGSFIGSDGRIWAMASVAGSTKIVAVIDPDGSNNVNTYIPVDSVASVRLAGYQDANTGTVYVFYEIDNSSTAYYYGNYIKKVVINNFVPDNPIVFVRGCGLFSKVFMSAGEYFIAVSYQSEFQSTYLTLNMNAEAVIRTNIGVSGGYRNIGMVCDVVEYDTGKFLLPASVKGRLFSEDNTVFSLFGVSVTRLSFNDRKNFIGATLGSNLNIVGGVLQSYDGQSFTENNFLIYPEGIRAVHTSFIVDDFVQGSTFTSASFKVTCAPGNAILTGSYFVCSSISTNFAIWFRVNGVGTAPVVPSHILIPVDIDSSDSAITVMVKLAAAMPTSDFSCSPFIGGTVGINVTNRFWGIVTEPSNVNVGAGNMIPGGSYLYKVTYEWSDNLGQIQRSTTSVPLAVSVVGSSQTLVIPTLRITGKRAPRSAVRIVIYRTENNGSTNYYRVTPVVGGIYNDETVDYVSFIDALSDSEIIANEVIYTTGGVLDNAAPPACSLAATCKGRIFIAGLEDKNLIWYSKTNLSGETVEFSDFLTYKVDPKGGDITGLGVIDDHLIIFKKSAIYILSGDGPNNTGSGNDFIVDNSTTDVGCAEPNSIVIVPDGLMFKSTKGIYLLNRSFSTAYIAAPVDAFRNEDITSATLCADNCQVRFTSSGNSTLVYDYFNQQWSTFTNLPAVDSDIWRGIYVSLNANGTVLKENVEIFTDGYAGVENISQFIPLKLTTSWISPSIIQGYNRFWRLLILGSYKSGHKLKVSFAYDYKPYDQNVVIVDAESIIGGNVFGASSPFGNESPFGGQVITEWFRIHLSQQRCTAIRITIEDVQTDNFGEGFDISSLTFEVGVNPGGFRLPTNQTFGNG